MFTFIACFGMWGGICGQIVKYENISAVECEQLRKSIPKETIGKGYIMCIPTSARRVQ